MQSAVSTASDLDSPKLINLHGQRIIIPNRNIVTIRPLRSGCIRAYGDIQLPPPIQCLAAGIVDN